MSDPLIILLILATNEAADPATAAAVAAARHSLGAQATVLVDERAGVPTDEEALSLSEKVHAIAVAEVIWEDETHGHVRIHVHIADMAGWIDREVTFDPADAPTERGRTTGLALASMISEPSAGELAPVEPKPALLPPIPERRAGPAPAPPHPALWYAAVDVAATGSLGIAGSAGGVGAAMGGRWYASSALALRAGGDVRLGEIGPARASLTTLSLGAGGVWRMFATDGPKPFELGLRADVLLVEQSLHRSSAGTTASRSRWISGADLLFETDWFFTRQLAIVGAVGAELAFGPTEVNVGADTVAVLPVARAVANLGFRVRF